MSTLVVTTRSGVRPLGVRGEPLHNAAGQLRRVVRRRLGDDTAGILADPQVHDDGQSIDWYSDWEGEVRPLVSLDAETRRSVLSDISRGLADISSLGAALAASRDSDDGGNASVVGRSLQLAARDPVESFVFLVGDHPVVVCWGYETENLPPAVRPALPRIFPAAASAAPPLRAASRPFASTATIPWLRTVMAALPLLLLLLAGSWLLRSWFPVDPARTLTTREAPPMPIARTAVPKDPTPVLKASLGTEQARAKALQLELTDIEGELKSRVAACRPVEPPRPPQVAIAPPPQKPVPPPQPAPPLRNPYDNRLRLPTTPTGDYSFLQGCWRTDPFRHELLQRQPGVSSYCFDANGYGHLEWRRGRTACRTTARARFEGSTLRLRDADTTCNDGSQWYADQLVCARGADNVANCSGNSRNAYGAPVSWTVNLHKLD
jgi:hypothetical protein